VIDAMLHAPIEDSFALLDAKNATAKLQAQGIQDGGQYHRGNCQSQRCFALQNRSHCIGSIVFLTDVRALT